MMKNIWQVPVYIPYLQPEITLDLITKAEEKIGFKLPEEYIDLLKQQNGGYIRYSLPDLVHDCISGIGPNYPSLTDFDWSEAQEYVSFELNGLVPFDGDGHWFICMDYRGNKISPAIVYIDTETDEETSVASSFSEYLSLLVIDADNQFVIESELGIESVMNLLSASMDTTFGKPDTSSHGYPIYQASIGNKDDHEWVWISENIVPRGFIRRDDSRYDELCHMMQGEVLRFPEVPKEGLIMTITESIKDYVMNACFKSSLVIKPVSDYL